MTHKTFLVHPLKEIIIIICFSLLCTALMVYLSAFEKLYLFTGKYPVSGFNELIIFFPAFIAIGFVLFSAKRIKELESEIAKRRKAEEALLESERNFRELSITDELTGLFNARYFFKKLRSELDLADRYSKPLSLILMDIDDFKKYNDTYGHLEGDKVLAQISQSIRSCMRATDSAYRYGGEEFVLILPETQGSGAANVAERIRKSFKSNQFFPTSDKPVHNTISLGVTEYVPEEDKAAFVKRADMNMYTAKRQGKDQVFFSRK